MTLYMTVCDIGAWSVRKLGIGRQLIIDCWEVFFHCLVKSESVQPVVNWTCGWRYNCHRYNDRWLLCSTSKTLKTCLYFTARLQPSQTAVAAYPSSTVRPSVRPSVTFVCCVKTSKHSHTILVLRTKLYGNIATGTTLTGASNAGGYEKIAIFDQYIPLSQKW